MSQVIIYVQPSGSVAVIHPTPEALADYGIQLIAQKDVPAGKPYKIIDAINLPDRSQRNAWTVDGAELTDGVGAAGNTFEELVK